MFLKNLKKRHNDVTNKIKVYGPLTYTLYF